MVKEHCLLGCFHSGINYRCLLGLCTVFHKLHPSTQRLINSHSAVTQLWNLVTLGARPEANP
jgi:hypothetical protein